MTVSEAQIERLLRNCDNVRVWLDKGNHANVAILLREIIEALAMKAAEPLQQGDEVERLIDELVLASWQEGGPSNVARLEKAKAAIRAALVRSKLPIGDDVREVLTEARRYVHETITTQARREIMLAKIDAAITAIGSQSIEGERGC